MTAPRAFADAAFQLLCLGDRVIERSGEELRHLPDTPLPAGRKTHWEQRHVDPLLPSDGIANRLRELRFPCAYIAGQAPRAGVASAPHPARDWPLDDAAAPTLPDRQG